MARHGASALRSAAVAIALLSTVAAAAFGADPPPFTILLGTAQDGGIPQIAAHSSIDEAARRDSSMRRLVVSLLVVDPRDGKRWLVDATPDLREQVDRADAIAPPRAAATGRPPLFDAIFLTHAHMGHYAGLLFLGREAYAANGQRVVASARMVDFLSKNAPWELLQRGGYIRLERFADGRPIVLAPGLSIAPIAVGHRAEYTDTFAFIVRGPKRSLFYLPDVDRWEGMHPPIEELVRGVDIAYLDGTFFDAAELPDRNLAEVPHPRIADSIVRFDTLPASERAKIAFLHLNHSNPAADPKSAASAMIRAAGLRVAVEGERQDL